MSFAPWQILFFALVTACVAQTPLSVRYEGLPVGGVYSNGYLFSRDDEHSQLIVYGRDAKPAFSVPDWMGDAVFSTFAVDSDGTIAVAYQPRDGGKGYIELLDRGGKLTQTIRTGSYIPMQVVFASDHTIWTISNSAEDDSIKDFNVLHHYAQSGEELGQTLLWSQTGGGPQHSFASSRGRRLLYSANDRIGWLAVLHPGFGTWIEVSSSGTFLGKYELGTPDGLGVTVVAMTANGDLYAEIFNSRPARYARFDRSKRVWQEVVGYPGGALIGSEGDSLAFETTIGDWTTIKLVLTGSLQISELGGK
jgi:hypothetical protein